jgi:type IV pilus assembly protein PilB
MAFGQRNRIGEILLHQGKVNPDQLQQAFVMQERDDRKLGDILLELGYVTEEDIAQAIAEQMRIPCILPDEDFTLSREEVRLIPEAIARRYTVVPMKMSKDPVVTLIMWDPTDIEAVETIQSYTRLEVHKASSTRQWINRLIDKFYCDEAHIESTLQDIVEDEAEALAAGGPENGEGGKTELEQLRVMSNEAPVVRLVNLLLMEAIRDNASDIHIEPAEHNLTVRLRVDGRLRETNSPPKSMHQALVTRIKILAGMDIAERRLPLDGRFKFRVQDRIIDIRVSTLPEAYGEKVVMRVLDRASLLVDMHDIGIEEHLLRRFQAVLKRPNGIILLTGPTGSGKTSTLYSALNFLKNPELNIQTVEDPVEYLIDGINQMQIKPGIGLTFAEALRSILRQDPDIVMIGEIRDLETAQIAMRASLTGHLVLSTLHTNDAPASFNRLADIGIPPYLTAATINLVVSQRLVRRLCDRCKKSAPPPPDHLAISKSVFPDADEWTYYHSVGCPTCSRTGFKGRIGILEYLEVSEHVRGMIVDKCGPNEIRNHALKEGMETLLMNGLRKVKSGITGMEEVLAVCAQEVSVLQPMIEEAVS